MNFGSSDEKFDAVPTTANISKLRIQTAERNFVVEYFIVIKLSTQILNLTRQNLNKDDLFIGFLSGDVMKY